MSPVECLSGKEMDSGVCCVLGCVETGASMQPEKWNKIDLRQIGFLLMGQSTLVILVHYLDNEVYSVHMSVLLLLYVDVL